MVVALAACGCAGNNTRGAGGAKEDRAAFDDGFAAFQAGQWQRAVDGFTRFLRSSPTSPQRGEVYYYRGQALAHLNRRKEAMDDFTRTLGAKPAQPVLAFARLAIGNLYYEEGNDAKAIEHYDEVLRGPQQDLPMDMLLLRLSVSLQRLGKWPAANRYLNELIQRYPDSPAAVEAGRRLPLDSFAVQVGAYGSLAAAQREDDRLRGAGFAPRLGDTKRSGVVLHTVQVGRAKTYAEAQDLARLLAEKGFATVIVP